MTGAPIGGAFIVADWRGSAFQAVQSSSGCYHVELTRSTDDGRYHVDLLSGNFNPLITDRSRSVALFKPGYEVKFFDETVEKRTALHRFSGTFQQRLEQYWRVWRNDCPDSRSRLRPVLEAINAEAQALAHSPDERVKAAHYQLELDTDSMGFHAAHDRYEENVRRIKSEAATK